MTDGYGVTHEYRITKADGTKYTSDECVMAALLSGLDYKNNKGKPVDPAAARKMLTGSKKKKASLNSLNAWNKALGEVGVICEKSNDEETVYVDIKGNLANGMPVILSIDGDSGPWRGESQRLLLIGMDEDGRAIVADTKDRKWFETDQRFKLTDIDELISYSDEGYIIIRDAQQ